MVEMIETKSECCRIISEDVKDAVVIEGSPEFGLIGNILGWLLVEELKMKQIGYIDSKEFPPLAVLYKGVAIHPFRIYSSEGIVLFLSDFIVPPEVSYDMSTAIVDWMERNNSKEFITFNSMVVMEKSDSVVWSADEVTVPTGYLEKAESNGSTGITITNTYNSTTTVVPGGGTPSVTTSTSGSGGSTSQTGPKTDDMSMMWLWFALMIASAVGLRIDLFWKGSKTGN